MSAALSYESLEDMPEGMRRLVEKQLAKKAEREATLGNVHGGASTHQSDPPTAPLTRGANFPLQPPAAAAPPEGEPCTSSGADAPPSPQGEGPGVRQQGHSAGSAVKGALGRNKYGNKPTERILSNGKCIKFGSKKEAAYYDSLLIQQRMGLVRNIRLQYQFLLKPAYTDGETGERFLAVSYLADFVFERCEDGQWSRVIVDTKGGKRKGTRTSTYAIKRKLMAEMGYIIEEA